MKYIFFVLAIVLCSCAKGPYTIKYTATGSSNPISVSYIDQNGNTQQYTGSSPWSYSFTAKKGAQLKVSSSCDVTGTNEVHIYINSVDKDHDTETGFAASTSTTAQ